MTFTNFTFAGGEDDKLAILLLLDRWRIATRATDIRTILELVADDVVFLPSTLPPMRGKNEVEQMYQDFLPRYREIEQRAVIEEIRVAGDWAFLWGIDELRLVPEAGGAEIRMKGKGLSVLKRQSDGSWRFWRGINNFGWGGGRHLTKLSDPQVDCPENVFE